MDRHEHGYQRPVVHLADSHGDVPDVLGRQRVVPSDPSAVRSRSLIQAAHRADECRGTCHEERREPCAKVDRGATRLLDGLAGERQEYRERTSLLLEKNDVRAGELKVSWCGSGIESQTLYRSEGFELSADEARHAWCAEEWDSKRFGEPRAFVDVQARLLPCRHRVRGPQVEPVSSRRKSPSREFELELGIAATGTPSGVGPGLSGELVHGNEVTAVSPLPHWRTHTYLSSSIAAGAMIRKCTPKGRQSLASRHPFPCQYQSEVEGSDR